MLVIPAIDLINGKVVRLYQGDYNKVEDMNLDPVLTATSFKNDQAKLIHIVDLDGAKAGKRINHEVIKQICMNVDIDIEVGGGIRSIEDIEYYKAIGVKRIILGSSAIKNPAFLKEAILKYKDLIVVGIDTKDGYIACEGWLETSNVFYLDFIKELEAIGVKNIIFTDISKDGTLQGPPINMLEKIKEITSMNVVASGGIKDLSHLEALKPLNLYGAITGKALYANTLNLKEAIEKMEG